MSEQTPTESRIELGESDEEQLLVPILLLAVMASLLGVSSASARQVSGSVSGRVTDQEHHALQGALVALELPASEPSPMNKAFSLFPQSHLVGTW